MSEAYELHCRQCGRGLGNAPVAMCEECIAPLEVAFDLERLRGRLTREVIAGRPPNLWRYRELLPIPADTRPGLPVGFTPLLETPRLGERLGAKRLYVKNDAVCLPSLSFKDRVVAVALERARAFGLRVVGCASTGNLANAVASQAARAGLEAWVFVPAGIEPTKIVASAVYGARVVPINGSYDQVNRLCSLVADRFHWGLVNVNLRPYYAEGSKTVGFEIAEQLGWRLPDNVVVPMAGGALISRIRKGFDELVAVGLVEAKPVKFFGAQATGCSPISTALKQGLKFPEPQKPRTLCHSLAIGNPADGYHAIETITATGGWAEDVADPEILSGMKLLAETEGIFTETAGGVVVEVTRKLIEQGRIRPEETTVLAITGNGLKTTESLTGQIALPAAVEPRLAAFEAMLVEAGAPAPVPKS
jgi:threonine synthase